MLTTCCTLLVILTAVALALALRAGVPRSVATSVPPVDTEASPMAAVFYTTHGDADVLQVGEIPKPAILPHQVLIQVKFASINPCDFKFRRNTQIPSFIASWMHPKPKIPGEDVSGFIADIGEAVPAGRFKVGDRVAAMMPIIHTRWGGAAQYAPVDYDDVAVVPEAVDLAEAAALPLVSSTVLQGLAKVPGYPESLKGKRALVQAGAGGVGSFAIQWLKRVVGMGHVSTTCSSRNAAFVTGTLGADEAIDYKTTVFEQAVMGDGGGSGGSGGVDLVVDPMSFLYEERTLPWDGNVTVIHRGGFYLNVVGSDWALDAMGNERANGPITGFNLLRYKAMNLLAAAPPALSYDMVTVSPNGEQLQAVLEEVRGGRIKAEIEQVFPLEQAADAHRLLETGHVRGKILLEIPQ